MCSQGANKVWEANLCKGFANRDKMRGNETLAHDFGRDGCVERVPEGCNRCDTMGSVQRAQGERQDMQTGDWARSNMGHLRILFDHARVLYAEGRQ